MAAPPSAAGAVHDSVTWPLPAAAAKLRGALSPPVVPDSETLTSSEGSPGDRVVPSTCTPLTWKAYVAPLVRPVTVLLVTVPLLWNSVPAKSVQRP